MAVNVMVNVPVKQNIIVKKDAPLKLHSDATKCCYNTLFLKELIKVKKRFNSWEGGRVLPMMTYKGRLHLLIQALGKG